jgi:hypothetical protein
MFHLFQFCVCHTMSKELHKSQHLEIPNPIKKKWDSDLEPSNRADDNYEEKTRKEKNEASQHPPPQTIAAGVFMKLHVCVCVSVCLSERERACACASASAWRVREHVRMSMHAVRCVCVCMRVPKLSVFLCFPLDAAPRLDTELQHVTPQSKALHLMQTFPWTISLPSHMSLPSYPDLPPQTYNRTLVTFNPAWALIEPQWSLSRAGIEPSYSFSRALIGPQ